MRSDHAGVGLGLAIVNSITQAHDGTLTLTPRAAGGLCVTVQLPITAAVARDPDHAHVVHALDRHTSAPARIARAPGP